MDLSLGCPHPVRVAGMCAVCGIAMDEVPSEAAGPSTQLHDFSGVQINNAEAARLDSEATQYLLSNRKLALIVDLDQTIIHATVDPTVGEWLGDVSNPNFSALQSVGKFRLGTDGKAVPDNAPLTETSGSTDNNDSAAPPVPPPPAANQDEGCWYYVKPRPGLQAFLAELSTKYEMHVYTMGTRSYAESVCRLVDPQGAIFGARILSRDENGSLLQKSLKKLFPMDTSMVVIIDDRADVWKWSPNLVKVIPFDFFVGIGDINASFLPSAPSATAPSNTSTAEVEELKEDTTEQNGTSTEKGGTAEMKETWQTSAEEAEATAVAERSQRDIVSEQLGSRPLAKMQEALNDKKEEAEISKQTISPAATAVLHDDDNELERLQDILDQVHTRWYGEWDQKQAAEVKPNTTNIIGNLKLSVLAGCTLAFSSVIPLQQIPQTSDLWRLASDFGATCVRDLDDSVTHLVAAKPDTEKVHMARQKGVSIVWPAWLHDSCAAWFRQPEIMYAIPKTSMNVVHESDAGGSSNDSDLIVTSFSPLNRLDTIGDEEEGDDEEDQGFGEMNWDEANDEVDAVLNGLTDDEDITDETGGYNTDDSANDEVKRKRNRSARSSNGSENGDAEEIIESDGEITLSPLSKRRKMAGMRVGQSKLKNEVAVKAQTPPKMAVKKDDSEYADTKSDSGNTDDDFLRTLEDELELQLDGDEDDNGEQGVPSDDE